MRIVVTFAMTDRVWDPYILANAARASEILSEAAFVERVRSGQPFDRTEATPAQVADAIANAGDVAIRVGYFREGGGLRGALRREKNKRTKAIGNESPRTGLVRFNRQKKREGAGSPGNIAHEVMHVLGFHHHGNRRAGNENTVPYRIGDWVDGRSQPGALSIGVDLRAFSSAT